MKKHVDRKRIGWTVGIPLIIAFGLVISGGIGYLLLICILKQQITSIGDYFVLCPVGLVIAVFIALIGYGIKEAIPAIIRFYYHNGEGEK